MMGIVRENRVTGGDYLWLFAFPTACPRAEFFSRVLGVGGIGGIGG